MTAHENQEKSEKNGESVSQVSASKRTRSYESRKVRKPLMEKRRRARINHSLNELKRILLEANGTPAKKEGNRPKKIEKADILEMAVAHLQSLHNNGHNGNHEDGRRSSLNNLECDKSSASSDEDDCSRMDDGLKINGPTTSSTQEDKHNNPILEQPTSFILGFAECIRLVQNAMKTMTGGYGLEEKLKSHLEELNRNYQSTFRSGKSGEMRHYEDPGFGSGEDDHELTALRCSDSPTSVSQLSPISLSGGSSWSSNGNGSNTKSEGTILIPTRMRNGEIAFFVRHGGEESPHGGKGIQGLGGAIANYTYTYNHGGACCGVVDTLVEQSHSSLKSFGYGARSTYSDNHLSGSAVWRPW